MPEMGDTLPVNRITAIQPRLPSEIKRDKAARRKNQTQIVRIIAKSSNSRVNKPALVTAVRQY